MPQPPDADDQTGLPKDNPCSATSPNEQAVPSGLGAENSKTNQDNKQTRFRAAVGSLSWTLLVITAAALAARWSTTSTVPTTALAGLTTLASIPLVIGLVGALVSRGLTLRLFAGLLASLFFVTTTPLEAAIGCRPSTEQASPSGLRAASDTLTILTANVRWGTGQPDKLAEMIVESDADIVSLQEVSKEVVDALSDDPTLADYVYSDVAQTNALWATVTFAKLPADRPDPTSKYRRISTTTFPTSDTNPVTTEVSVTSVHLRAPITSEKLVEWQGQLVALAERPTDEPAILVGDFNATEDHKLFRNLLDRGWTDVHQEKGCGLDATFPSKQVAPIAILRLDHVLVTDHFDVLRVDVIDPTNGSDHNPVITTIRRNDD